MADATLFSVKESDWPSLVGGASTGRLDVKESEKKKKKKKITYCTVPWPAVSSAGRCYILFKESDWPSLVGGANVGSDGCHWRLHHSAEGLGAGKAVRTTPEGGRLLCGVLERRRWQWWVQILLNLSVIIVLRFMPWSTFDLGRMTYMMYD